MVEIVQQSVAKYQHGDEQQVRSTVKAISQKFLLVASLVADYIIAAAAAVGGIEKLVIMSGADNNYVFEDLYGTMIRVENKVNFYDAQETKIIIIIIIIL